MSTTVLELFLFLPLFMFTSRCHVVKQMLMLRVKLLMKIQIHVTYQGELAEHYKVKHILTCTCRVFTTHLVNGISSGVSMFVCAPNVNKHCNQNAWPSLFVLKCQPMKQILSSSKITLYHEFTNHNIKCQWNQR